MIYTNIDLYSGIARKADLHNPKFLELIKELEAHQAAHLAGGWQRHWARRWELPFVFSSILALDYGVIKEKMILESGSGFTVFPLWLASYGAKLTLVDFDKTLEKIWDDINSRISFANHPIVFNTADMQNLPYPDNNFDIAYSISAIEHTNDPIQSLSEMLRVTKSGGHIVFTMDLDIQNTDSVSRDQFHVIRSLLTLQINKTLQRVFSNKKLIVGVICFLPV